MNKADALVFDSNKTELTQGDPCSKTRRRKPVVQCLVFKLMASKDLKSWKNFADQKKAFRCRNCNDCGRSGEPNSHFNRKVDSKCCRGFHFHYPTFHPFQVHLWIQMRLKLLQLVWEALPNAFQKHCSNKLVRYNVEKPFKPWTKLSNKWKE